MEDEFIAGHGSDVLERTLSMHTADHADDTSVRQTCLLVMSRDFFPAAVRAAARREPQLPRGLRVLLHGLRARPELNGGAAEVIGAVDAASGRIAVQLIAPAQFAGERMKLKLDNIQVDYRF